MKSAHPDECKQKADGINEVNKHQQLENIDLKCQPCGAIFFDGSHLTKHNQVVHEKLEKPCDICGKLFTDVCKHKKNAHSKERNFDCFLPDDEHS